MWASGTAAPSSGCASARTTSCSSPLATTAPSFSGRCRPPPPPSDSDGDYSSCDSHSDLFSFLLTYCSFSIQFNSIQSHCTPLLSLSSRLSLICQLHNRDALFSYIFCSDAAIPFSSNGHYFYYKDKLSGCGVASKTISQSASMTLFRFFRVSISVYAKMLA